MEFNSEETKKYTEYMRKINEYWQDQVDAGSWGRANLSEVLAAFGSLLKKISEDPVLSQKYKEELSEIIEEKKKIAVPREAEILKAEKIFSDEQYYAYEKAVEAYKKANPWGGNRAQVRLREMVEKKGYKIFFSPDELRALFTGEGNFERLNQEYPIIAQDLNELVTAVIQEKKGKDEK